MIAVWAGMQGKPMEGGVEKKKLCAQGNERKGEDSRKCSRK
jgi:hypothetical protein